MQVWNSLVNLESLWVFPSPFFPKPSPGFSVVVMVAMPLVMILVAVYVTILPHVAGWPSFLLDPTLAISEVDREASVFGLLVMKVRILALRVSFGVFLGVS
jgi:hypothetical protein